MVAGLGIWGLEVGFVENRERLVLVVLIWEIGEVYEVRAILIFW